MGSKYRKHVSFDSENNIVISKSRFAKVGEAPEVQLRVEPISEDCSDSGTTSSGRPAIVGRDAWDAFSAFLQGAPPFLQLASGSDCLVAVCVSDDEAMTGIVRLEHAQRVNLHVAVGETYTFKCV